MRRKWRVFYLQHTFEVDTTSQPVLSCALFFAVFFLIYTLYVISPSQLEGKLMDERKTVEEVVDWLQSEGFGEDIQKSFEGGYFSLTKVSWLAVVQLLVLV